LEDRSR
jgi:hypothetical protein